MTVISAVKFMSDMIIYDFLSVLVPLWLLQKSPTAPITNSPRFSFSAHS